jgi:hypothetical protein
VKAGGLDKQTTLLRLDLSVLEVFSPLNKTARAMKNLLINSINNIFKLLMTDSINAAVGG